MGFLFTWKLLKIAVTSAVIFVVLDILWIGFFAANMYADQLGYLGRLEAGKVTFNLPVGILVQVIISIGLTVIISTALQLDNRLLTGILMGAFTGFVLYCTYDLTNLSFVKDWPLRVTLIDIGWGTLQGLMAGAYVYALGHFFEG